MLHLRSAQTILPTVERLSSIQNYSLPAFHILMTKKTITLYDQVKLKIKETLNDIMTDNEDALFHALSLNYPDVRAVGCMFHHDQALYKTGILKNGLSDLYLTNRELRNWAELLLPLPYFRQTKLLIFNNTLNRRRQSYPNR